MISTSLISCSRMLRRRTKCVGTPIAFSCVIRYSLMRLLSTPLPSIVAFFVASKAVVSSLKYWMTRAGLGPLVEDLGLALVDHAAALHVFSPPKTRNGASQSPSKRQNSHGAALRQRARMAQSTRLVVSLRRVKDYSVENLPTHAVKHFYSRG